MLKRKITEQLSEWKRQREKDKNKKAGKCLLVRGARQVGKTFAIEEFGRTQYEEMLEINFKELPLAKDIFSGDLNTDTMLMAMRFRFPKHRMEPGKTLLFFDEIQECEEAITSLKFWAIDNRYDVIASGSMLGIDYKRASSYPVGYVDYLEMYGLDFEEFLWSRNITEDMIRSLETMYSTRSVVPESIHSDMMRLFREYICVGGMPEVVQHFVDTEDFREVDRVQRALLMGYQYDIAHYASAEEKVKAEKCYLSLGRQLLDKENHKFQYKEVESGGRAQKYYSSVEWLLRADLIRMCRMATDLKYDLEDYAREDFFRAYPTDLSLLMAMKDYALKQHVMENTLIGTTKGGLYESAVADILLKKQYPLFFFKNETMQKELDFLTQKDGFVIPIEVKSGNTRANTLNWLKKRNPGIEEMYKLIDGNIGVGENGIISLPLYMAMFL